MMMMAVGPGCGPPPALVTVIGTVPLWLSLVAAMSAVPGATPVTRPLLLTVATAGLRSEEHTSELQSRLHLVCRLLLEKKKTTVTARYRNLVCDSPNPTNAGAIGRDQPHERGRCAMSRGITPCVDRLACVLVMTRAFEA